MMNQRRRYTTCPVSRAFTIMEMLFSVILLAVFSLIAGPLMVTMIHSMAKTTAYENQTDAWLAARSHLASDVQDAYRVQVIGPHQLLCTSPGGHIIWKIAKGNLSRKVGLETSRPGHWQSASWPCGKIRFMAAVVGVKVTRDAPHQHSTVLLTNRIERARMILEAKP